MRSIAIVIASLAAMLALTSCAGVRAEVGAIPTDAPPAPVPTPQVIVIREPAPADTGVNGFVVAGLIIIGLGLGMGVSALIVATAFARSRSAPERSQLNERPTYVAPPARLVLPDEWSGWSFYRKDEYLRANGYGAGERERIIAFADEPLALPPPRR